MFWGSGVHKNCGVTIVNVENGVPEIEQENVTYYEAVSYTHLDVYKRQNQNRELKHLVKTCHKSGIEVILNLPFMDGISHSLITDCIRYYTLEYHVDGFVVNPYCAPFEELRKDPLLANIKILKQQDDFQDIMLSLIHI